MTICLSEPLSFIVKYRPAPVILPLYRFPEKDFGCLIGQGWPKKSYIIRLDFMKQFGYLITIKLFRFADKTTYQ